MKELGITKGESVYPKAQPVARNGFYILTDTAFIGEVGGGYLEIEQYKALAELFADAGNTAQSCGLLPSELLRQRDELKEDIEYLARRQQKAGSVSFTAERETGVSSNSIVSIAYGIVKLEDQSFPSDWSDLNACRNMWKKLPEHRKTGDALIAMERAEAAIKSTAPKREVIECSFRETTGKCMSGCGTDTCKYHPLNR